MHVTAHWGCMNIAIEYALKDDCWGAGGRGGGGGGGGGGRGGGGGGKNNHLAAPGDRTSISVRHCTT